ncbi:ATPase, F1/V1/A1 complex, alpha/beta subunit, Zinc knuckle CX2CX4HX4C [Artemisia annua]|uniref:ATPase, F1/V1/A1 complex, alpha/beta subunit, Zinc knuckle CX2CX4HX4C n=1 Tax=Artemisia annua TaxID=35608 RepID=A0A2U1LEZ1_ARTAN|nr:ATPase, F1/V1/A1 complex, alpha/beta subunit, Zinc knuckle CX2CX4HX4C [Artemisia annua]
MTANMCYKGVGNLEFARVLVEMDVEKEFKKFIEIQYRDVCNNIKGSKKVQVVYNWQPPICSHCKVFGHDVKQCKKVVVIENDVQRTANDTNGEKSKNVNCEEPSTSTGQRNGRNSQVSNNTVKGPNSKNFSNNVRAQNGDARKNVNEYKRQEYRKKQLNTENIKKVKEKSNLKTNMWNVKDKGVEELRKTANTYSILDYLPEDSDQEGNKEAVIEDVLELNSGIAKAMGENVVTGMDGMEKRKLWKELSNNCRYVNCIPWCIAGDMNVIWKPNEHSCGVYYMSTDMVEY